MRVLEILSKYWVLIAAVFVWSSSLAVGEYRIQNLENAMKVQIQQSEKVHAMEVNQGAMQQQLKSIDGNIEKQNQLQMKILDRLIGGQ